MTGAESYDESAEESQYFLIKPDPRCPECAAIMVWRSAHRWIAITNRAEIKLSDYGWGGRHLHMRDVRGAHHKNRMQRQRKEREIVPTHEPARRFPVRFYLIAMAFVVVDIEIIFLFPWAVDSQGLGRFGLVEILVFAASVFVPFIYLVANGALDWGPLKRVRPLESEAVRTSSSTVRHIGPSSDEAA